MSAAPNAQVLNPDFEFAALQEARRYRAALLQEFSAALQGRVLEVGAGTGQITEGVFRLPGVQAVTCVEPEARFVRQIRARFPSVTVVEGTVEALPTGEAWNAILSVNVLEHIEEDGRELGLYHSLLKEQRGALCLFVPARPEIYAPLDGDLGHFRRYTRKALREALVAAGFSVERIHYFNLIGYFAWWFTFRLLRRRHFDVASVRWFDSVIFPPMHFVESRLARPPFGQSLLAVARA